MSLIGGCCHLSAFAVVLHLLAAAVQGEPPRFSPGQPTLLKAETNLRMADGESVVLSRGEYVRVRRVHGDRAQVASIVATGEVAIESLYTLDELRAHAPEWLNAIKLPQPAPEAVMFALFSSSGVPERLIKLLPDKQQKPNLQELAFHRKVEQALQKPSFEPSSKLSEEQQSEATNRRPQFQTAYLQALSRRPSPSLNQFLENSRETRRQIGEGLLISFIQSENPIPREEFLKDSLERAARLPQTDTADPLYDAIVAIHFAMDISGDVAGMKHRYIPSGDYEKQVQHGLRAIASARELDEFDGVLWEVNLALKYCEWRFVHFRRDKTKSARLAHDLYQEVVRLLKCRPFQSGLFSIAAELEETFTAEEIVSYRKRNKHLYAERYENLAATLELIPKPGSRLPIGIVWANFRCAPSLPGKLSDEFAVERFLHGSSFDTALLPRLVNVIDFIPVGSDVFKGPLHFTFEMKNENLDELRKYSGADLYLVWQLENLDADMSQMKLGPDNLKLIESARRRTIHFTTDR